MLAVSDTGSGMDEQTCSRVFEPFFTTKETGKGTGLGLATVYGIVKQSGGDIRLYSELGVGTTFKVYLPRVAESGLSVRAGRARARSCPRGDETVLLVEDEPEVRDLAREILEEQRLHRAPGLRRARRPCSWPSAMGARSSCSSPTSSCRAQSGRALVERLRPLRPEMQVLYMSGYTNEAIVRHGVLDPDTLFIQKPFSPAALGHKVRAALDGSPRLLS